MSTVQAILDMDHASRTRGHAAASIAGEYAEIFNSTRFHDALVQQLLHDGVPLHEADELAGAVHHATGELASLHGEIQLRQGTLSGVLARLRDRRRKAIDARSTSFRIN